MKRNPLTATQKIDLALSAKVKVTHRRSLSYGQSQIFSFNLPGVARETHVRVNADTPHFSALKRACGRRKAQ